MTVSEKLRLVHGLHYHAEIFGFNWDDGSDWTWHDVACKIADEVDAENAKLRMRVTSLESALEGMRLIREMDVADNVKLREFAKEACEAARDFYNLGGTFNDLDDLICEACELGVEVDDA